MATSSFEKEFIVSNKQSKEFENFMQSDSPVHTVCGRISNLVKHSKTIKIIDPRKIK